MNFAKVAAAALGVGLSASAFVGMIKGSIDAAEALKDLSTQTGISVEALSAFSDLGKYTDTSVQTIAGSINRMQKAMEGAGAQSGDFGRALQAIGVDFDKFQKMKPEDQLLTIARNLERFADGSGKSAAAMAFFGKSGAELLPFLKDLAAQQRLNSSVTAEQAEMADRFNDRITALKGNFEIWIRSLTLDFLPALQKIIEGLGTAISVTGSYLVLMKGLPIAVTAAKAAFDYLHTSIAAASAAAEIFGTRAAIGVVGSLKAITAQVGVLKLASSTLFAAFAGWQIGKYLSENFLWAQLAGIRFVEALLVGWERVKYGAQALWLLIKSAAVTAFDGILKAYAAMAGAIGRGLSALGITSAGEALQEFAARVRDAAASGVSLEKELYRVKLQMDSNIATIREITTQQKLDAESKFRVIKATADTREQLRLLGDQELEEIVVTAKRIKLQEDAAAATSGHAKAQREVVEAIAATSAETVELTKFTVENIAVTNQQIEELRRSDEIEKAWAQTTQSIFDGLTDAIYRSAAEGEKIWASLASAIKGLFQNLVLQPTIRAVMGPVAGAMGGLMTGTASAATAGLTGGKGSGILGTLGQLGGLTGLGSMFGSGLGFGLIGGFGGGAGVLGTLGAGASMFTGGLAGGMAGIGSTLAGVGAMLGAVAPIAAAVYAIWKGFSRGPKVVKETGITGEILGGDATARLYEKWKQSGGWIVGDRKGTRYKDLGEEMSAGLDQAAAGVYGQVKEWTKAIGLPAEQLAEVTRAISIKIGKDDAETQANIEAALEGYRSALAARFEGVLEPFRNAGETLTETLQRLVGIQAMSEQLNQFGGVFSRIANLSVDAREELIGFAGGIEALLAKTQSFVSAYYSEGEQAAIAAKQIRAALGAMGISGDVSSKGDFRALVEAVDVSTTEGRKQLDALLSIAQTFAPVADYLGKAGGTLASLADQAPQSELLRSIFEASQGQAETQVRVADGVDRVNESINFGTRETVGALAVLSAKVDVMASRVEQAIAASSRSITSAIELAP